MATPDATPTRSRIFISYRREDAEHAVGRLAEDLRKYFPRDQVFQDIASIDPGADFVEALQQALDTCAAVLVVIGPRWLGVTDPQGRRRLDFPDDWVRHEVAESLRQPGVRVFPVLLDANMPSAESLPEDLKPLTRRQAFPLTVRHWPNDVARLVEFLRKVPGVATTPVLDAKAPTVASSEAALEGHTANQGGGTGGSAHVAAELEQRPDSLKTEVRSGLPKEGRLSRHKVRWMLAAAILVALAVAAVAFFRSDLPWTRPIAIHGPKPLYMPFKTGDVFQECAECPEMVVIVADRTMLPMDMPASEAQKFKPYAIGKFEITRAQFRASGVRTGAGCYPRMREDSKLGEQLNAEHAGFEQSADHPVVCVSWNEIQGYLAWLNKQDGLKLAYRLPAQFEWDIAARGGGTAWQYWGEDNDQACDYGNVFDRTAAQTFAAAANYQCSDGYAHTAPVGRFKPNAFGLHDMIGNVWEWLEDCGRIGGRRDCAFRVGVGGSWAPGITDDYRRYYLEFSDARRDHLGFRVARDL